MVWREARGVGTQRAAEAAIIAGVEDLRGGSKQRWTTSLTLLKSMQVRRRREEHTPPPLAHDR